MALLSIWWAWIVLGAGLAVLEVLVPGFIFLGFAIAAVFMAAVMALGLLTSLGFAILVYALLALAAWLVLRRVFGTGEKDVKVWRDDINDN
ncbi:MAG: NfeD family protein [Cypionkella sp.]